MAAKLSSFGFCRSVNCEAIVTTLNPDGTPNAAPMGMIMTDEGHLQLNVFNTAYTCRNLKAQRCAVINLTSDIYVYLRSTFKEANPTGKIPSSWFSKSTVVAAPKLRNADATIEIQVVSVQEGAERTMFGCRVEYVSAKEQMPQVYCRALPLTVEAITHATRVKAFLCVPEKKQHAEELISTIQEHRRVVERVAPESDYTAVFVELERMIASWRIQQ